MILRCLSIAVACSLTSVPSLANDADDTIARLADQARAQAASHANEEMRRTLADISASIPSATLQGVATANALLAELSRTVPKDGAAATEPTAAAGPAAVAPAAVVPPTPTPTPAETMQPSMSLTMRELMQRQGAAALRNGDISGARRFYQKGAEGGCAACADALANTYDAEWLSNSGAVGIKPDQTQSGIWRALARQLTQATNQ